MTLEEQLADTGSKVAHLAGKLDLVIPRLDGLVPRGECEVRHDGLQQVLDNHRAEIVKAVVKNGNGDGNGVTLELVRTMRKGIALLGSVITLLSAVLYYTLR